jgi:hypothetical protein
MPEPHGTDAFRNAATYSVAVVVHRDPGGLTQLTVETRGRRS